MYQGRVPSVDGALEVDHPCYGCPVRDLAVCNALDAVELGEFRRSGSTRAFKVGDTLCWEGDPAEQVFNVTHGVLRLSKLLPDGRRQVTGFAFPGDFVGLAVEDQHPFTAEAVSPARVCRFSRARFDAFVDSHPELERRLYTAATHELAAARDQLVLLGRKTAVERLASFILAMAERTRQGSADEAPRATLPMSRLDMADYLGMRIETVSRELGALKTSRLIRMTGVQDLVILDPRGLEALASGCLAAA
jgi:CRP/FNR family transcriptional regulator